jgi:hypothetical protein
VSSIFDAQYHRQRVRDLAQEPPDEPTYCELKREFAYATNAEKAELVKDIVSFANSPLEHHGGFGYLIFGVSQDGGIFGVADPLPGDPPSEIRNLLNKYLERPVVFEFVTITVEDSGENKRLAAVVVPNSRRRPHVISRVLQEQQGKKTKFFLREQEVWVRKAGGRDLATAEDMDAMYEARLLSAVRDATEPLARRVEDLEGELARLRSASPEPSFGVALPGEREPVQEAMVRPATEVLITGEAAREIASELSWAASLQERAEKERRQRASDIPFRVLRESGERLDPQRYAEYQENLKDWVNELRDFVMVELALTNTGEVPAEDVSVEVEIPQELSCYEELPREKPERPVNTYLPRTRAALPRFAFSKQNAPEALIGPELDYDRRLAIWEVGRLYHGRPVRTDSEPEYVEGLLLDREPFERASSEEGVVELRYTIRAANLRRPVEGVLRLSIEPADQAEGTGSDNSSEG